MNRGFLSLVLAVLGLVFVSIVVLSSQAIHSENSIRSVENVPASQLHVWLTIDRNVANFFNDPVLTSASCPSTVSFSIHPSFTQLDDGITCQLTTPSSVSDNNSFTIPYQCDSGARGYHFEGSVLEKYSWAPDPADSSHCIFVDEYAK